MYVSRRRCNGAGLLKVKAKCWSLEFIHFLGVFRASPRLRPTELHSEFAKGKKARRAWKSTQEKFAGTLIFAKGQEMESVQRGCEERIVILGGGIRM